jgi:ribosomal protein S18 acetylase RimI-like enzyme
MCLKLIMPDKDYQILQLDRYHPKQWIREVAEIHHTELVEGTLRNLGVEGLEVIYSSMVTIPRCGIWCAIDSNRVIGFIAGCADIRRFYKSVLINSAFPLAYISLQRILNSHSFGNLFMTLVYPFQSSRWIQAPEEVHDTRAELVAIAVRKEFHHQGIGRMLLLPLEEAFHEWQIGSCYHVATDSRDPLSNGFYQGMRFSKYGEKKFTNFTLQIYEKKL